MTKALPFKRVVIFGRPGSGKSTFAVLASQRWGLPLYHLNKYFYGANWQEREYSAFLKLHSRLVRGKKWILDGNSLRSLEMRWSQADLVLYFNFPKSLCLVRILKRLLWRNSTLDDRAPGCGEKLTLSLLRYLWTFEERVAGDVAAFKTRYPHVVCQEIKSGRQLRALEEELMRHGVHKGVMIEAPPHT